MDRPSTERIPVSESEYEFVKRAAEHGFVTGSIEDASRILGLQRSTVESIVRLLQDKGIVRLREVTRKKLVLTERGKNALKEGLPEERVLPLIIESIEIDTTTLKDKFGKTAGVAIGNLVKLGIIEIRNGVARLKVTPDEAKKKVSVLREVINIVVGGGKVPDDFKWALNVLKKRGLIKEEKIKKVIIEFTEDPSDLLKKLHREVARLSHKLLRSGEWRKVELRKYDVTASPPTKYPARIHFLTEFIEMLRDLMKELGFKEVEGPLVEIELYNFDLLFQPQDHPAREIHDTLWIKKPERATDLPLDLIERARRVHERSWKYIWNQNIAARLVLRSQTTSVSARVLASKPTPPLRVFTIGRVFRSDVVDSTHLPEFHQLDGLDGEPGYTFRDLLGILKEISERLGFEIKFKPAYFPFTEPSVEGYVRLPNGKWLELFGAGLMRPEVLEMAGIDYPVGAWGFGVERLAATYYGIPDIRMLYTKNIEYIQKFPKKLR